MANPHLVDELETAFHNCIAPLVKQDVTTAADGEEIRSTVDQNVQKLMDVSRQLERFFLQKRHVLSINKPEKIVIEDITELKAELQRKETLLQKNLEKLQVWQNMLSRAQSTQGTPQIPQPNIQAQAGAASQQPQAAAMAAQAAQPQIMQHQMSAAQSMPPPSVQPLPQGPLAYLEQTTSNIGLPERR